MFVISNKHGRDWVISVLECNCGRRYHLHGICWEPVIIHFISELVSCWCSSHHQSLLEAGQLWWTSKDEQIMFTVERNLSHTLVIYFRHITFSRCLFLSSNDSLLSLKQKCVIFWLDVRIQISCIFIVYTRVWLSKDTSTLHNLWIRIRCGLIKSGLNPHETKYLYIAYGCNVDSY